MGIADELIANNVEYAKTYQPDRPLPPRRKLAIVACMDSRLDTFAMLGLEVGDAHVMRNAGGVITDDMIRSLVISQRKLGTREIILIHHTDCGALTFTDDELRNELLRETGIKPAWSPESFTDLEAEVRQSMERLRRDVFLLDTSQIRGFIFDVGTGKLNEIV